MLGLAGACASQPAGPFFGDERFLRFGVDPSAEADALTAQLERAGYTLARRVRGQYFTALGFVDTQGLPSVLRVVTARGIALALDARAGDVFVPSEQFQLLPAPFSDTHDADGDGFEEVFVWQAVSGQEPCVQPYRVRDSGFVDRVEQDNYALAAHPDTTDPRWQNPQFCSASAAGDEAPAASEGGADSAPAR